MNKHQAMIEQLGYQLTEKLFNSPAIEHITIMKSMIAEAFYTGREVGLKEMSEASRLSLQNIIPDYRDL